MHMHVHVDVHKKYMYDQIKTSTEIWAGSLDHEIHPRIYLEYYVKGQLWAEN